MIGYERSYLTGRMVAAFVEIAGWVLVGIGVLAALIGLATGGLIGGATRGFGGGDPGIIIRVIAMLPGILICWSGLVSVMLSQMGKASLDSAEMQRELLSIARGGKTHGNKAAVNSSQRPSAEDEFVKAPDFNKLLRTHNINKSAFSSTEVFEFPGPAFYVSSIGGYRAFPSLSDAEAFVKSSAQ